MAKNPINLMTELNRVDKEILELKQQVKRT